MKEEQGRANKMKEKFNRKSVVKDVQGSLHIKPGVSRRQTC